MKKFLMSFGIGMMLFSFLFFALSFIKNTPNVNSQLSQDEIRSMAKEIGMLDSSDITTVETTTTEPTEPVELSDYEIQKMAREIGMVYPEDVVAETQAATTTGDAADTTTTTEAVDITTAEGNESTETSEVVETTTAVVKEKIGVRIISGMNAKEIVNLLAEKTIIKDAKDFEKYVISKELTKKLRTGYYYFQEDEDYDTILNTITTVKKK